jgi:hypothetical protein
VSSRRLAVVAPADVAKLHGLDGRFDWGEARTFAPEQGGEVADWAPAAVVSLGVSPPVGPWASIRWGAPGERQVSAVGGWRRAPLPAADALIELQHVRGAGVVLAGGTPEERESALVKLRPRVAAYGVERLTLDTVEGAAVVALLGEPGAPLPDLAPAMLVAGRLLVAPRAAPDFGFIAGSDYLPYENEDELVHAADAAATFPEAFESLAVLGALTAEAHLASRVYGRLAVDVEFDSELLGDPGCGAVEHPPADDEGEDDQGRRDQ